MSESRPGSYGGADVPSADVPAAGGVPRYVRIAGAITMAQGAVAIIVAVVLVIREAAGHEEAAISGYGTAAWLRIIFGGVLAGGAALWFGRRWGRAISVVAQILLLPVSYYLVTSGQAVFGVPLALIAIAVLVMLFMPSSVQWLASDYAPDAHLEAPRAAGGGTSPKAGKPSASGKPAGGGTSGKGAQRRKRR